MDYPPLVVDKIQTISQCVSASRTSGKVALVWQAPPGEYVGDTESLDRNELDEGLGSSQRFNEIFYKISEDMGASWGSTVNVTQHDSTARGWLGQGDMSILIDQSDYLHILTSMREVLPPGIDGGYGQFAHFYGARLQHWDEYNNVIRTVKDANWDIPDSGCIGGAWNEMAIVKPSLSQCDGKFYAFFVQFNDIYNGISNDCHEGNFTGDYSSNTANGEIWMSISDDGGFSWGTPYNLTNTYTPHCWQDDTQSPLPVCESDHYVSSSRFGMDITGGNFPTDNIVDPTGSYAGNHFIDVSYINDKFPGSAIHDDGIWTVNPYKWFRVPCIEPQFDPCMPYVAGIDFPTWTLPGVQLDTTLRIPNPCSYDLTLNSISTYTISGPSGWLDVDNYGPITIGTDPDYFDLGVMLNKNGIITLGPTVVEGGIILTNDVQSDTIPVELVVADNVQFPELSFIRTECKRMIFDNTGNMGHRGYNDGEANLAFFDDCDTTDNDGSNDRANIYLYDASPFILRIDGIDTLFSASIFDATWLNEPGFLPLEESFVDSVSFADYQYAYSGRFTTKDSSLVIIQEFFAPKNIDSCDFIISRQSVYNNTDNSINNVIIGNIFDWDIPSDSGVANGSGYNDMVGMTLMYCYGGEYGPDSEPNNDCVLADQRSGGLSFY